MICDFVRDGRHLMNGPGGRQRLVATMYRAGVLGRDFHDTPLPPGFGVWSPPVGPFEISQELLDQDREDRKRFTDEYAKGYGFGV